MRRLLLPFVAFLAVASFAACSHNGPTTVESITILKDDGSGKPGDAVESIKPSDHLFHASIKLDVGTDKKIATELLAIDSAQGKDISVLSKDYDLSGMENTITLDYSLPNDWPTGKYKVNVSTGGKLLKTKEFMVQ